MKDNDISVYLSGDDLKTGKVSSVRTESFVQVNSNTTGYFSLVSSGKAISTSPADNLNTGGGSTAVVTEKASQKNISVTKQTNLTTKENPDEKERLLDITSGAGNKAMSVILGGNDRPQEKIPDTVIPISEVLKKGNPFWMLLSAAVLGIIGAVYGGVLIIEKFKKH